MFYKLHRIQHNTNAWHTFEPINKINKQDTEEPQRETKRKLMGDIVVVCWPICAQLVMMMMVMMKRADGFSSVHCTNGTCRIHTSILCVLEGELGGWQTPA